MVYVVGQRHLPGAQVTQQRGDRRHPRRIRDRGAALQLAEHRLEPLGGLVAIAPVWGLSALLVGRRHPDRRPDVRPVGDVPVGVQGDRVRISSHHPRLPPAPDAGSGSPAG